MVVIAGFFLLSLLSVAAALTSTEQNAIRDCHNALRSAVAKGTAQNKTGLLPAGKNLIQLKYNSSIEATAQSWANGCSMSHSGNGFGENLYMTSSSTVAASDALRAACQMWWKEVVQFGIQASLQLTVAEFNKGIGHWSQMAWANTAQIGCAVGRCPSSTWKTFVVCNYKSAGNYLNQNVYQKGAACSGCASGSACNSTSGLCVMA